MKKLSIIAMTLSLVIAGCVRFEEPTPSKEIATEEAPQTRAGSTATFQVLSDPYALANMQAVYNEFEGKTKLEPTDLYVRFKPQDGEQLRRLEEDYELDLYDYPLDLDIPDGEQYVDPTIPDGELGWYYITVKPNFVFPQDIEYEIIRECYIPDEGETIEPELQTRSGGGALDVEKLAFERLGYITEPQTRSGGGGGQYPDGFVRLVDGRGDSIPIAGIRVKINSYTKIRFINADSSGYFRSDWKFWDSEVRYSLTL